jgi:LuxR family maltose regulon positive regulatory protein
VRGYLLTLGALLNAVAGDHASALATARKRIRDHQPGYGGWGAYVVTWFAARVATICADRDALREFTASLQSMRVALGSAATPERMRPTVPLIAQLDWLDDRVDEAIRGWREALAYEEQIDMHGQAVECRVRLARALLRRGEVEEAARTLDAVFARSEPAPAGVLLAGDALSELAAYAWGRALPAGQIAQLREWGECLAQYRSSVAASTHGELQGAAADARAPGQAEPLTVRELDVLARVAAGDSNKLIARALDLSLHTVKRHVANILGKLDVETRGQAAAWYHGRHA